MLSWWFPALLELLNMCTMVSLLVTAASVDSRRDPLVAQCLHLRKAEVCHDDRHWSRRGR